MADNTQLSLRSGDGEVIRTVDRGDTIKIPTTLIDVGGAAGPEALIGDSGVSLPVQSSVTIVDDAAFTPATSKVAMVGYHFDDVTPDSVNEGDGGAARMSANRCQYMMLRDGAGNERGASVNASNQLDVAVGNTVTVGTHAVTQSGTWNVGTVTTVTTVSTVTAVSDASVQGKAAHDAAVSGNPVLIGLEARSTDPSAVSASGDAVRGIASMLGKQVTLPYAIPASSWTYAAASGGIVNTTGVTAKAAAGAGIRNYVTRAQIINGHATVSTDIQIRDGASGTVLWRGFAQAGGGGVTAVFDPPLRGSANTLIEVACGTTGSATYFNLQGYTAGE